MPTKHHRLVLGILESVPKGIELYQALLKMSDACDVPIILTHPVTKDLEGSLEQAGLLQSGSIKGIGIHHVGLDGHQSLTILQQPWELIHQLIDNRPELFWSLVDEYLSKGQIMIALSLKGMQETEINLTKLILRYAVDQVHLIDLT